MAEAEGTRPDQNPEGEEPTNPQPTGERGGSEEGGPPQGEGTSRRQGRSPRSPERDRGREHGRTRQEQGRQPTSLEQENQRLARENQGLRNRLSRVEQELESVQGERDAARAQMAQMERRMTQLEQELTRVQEQLQLAIDVRKIIGIHPEQTETRARASETVNRNVETVMQRINQGEGREQVMPEAVRIRREQQERETLTLPEFHPETYFPVPSNETFDPNRPFAERSAGMSAKSQLVHTMYRTGYGGRGLRGEEIYNVESRLTNFQAVERQALLDYHAQLLIAIPERGGNLDSPQSLQLIRNRMVEAKRALERHLIANYAGKVNQERRSNWWLRFMNFLNSDIAERRTIGDAMDIVTMNGGNLENALAAVENLRTDRIVAMMNAHVRRAIKKSLDWSQEGYMVPDSALYDRHQTYRILQDEYLQRMAREISRPTEGASAELTLPTDRAIVVRILGFQRDRLETIETSDTRRRWHGLYGRLITFGTLALVSGLLISNLISRQAEQSSESRYIQRPVATQSQAQEQIAPAPADSEADQEDTAEETRIDIGGGEELVYDHRTKESRIESVPSPLPLAPTSEATTETMDKTHRVMAQAQVYQTSPEKERIEFDSRRENLTRLSNTYDQLSSEEQERFNAHLQKNYPAAGVHEGESVPKYIDRLSGEITHEEEEATLNNALRNLEEASQQAAIESQDAHWKEYWDDNIERWNDWNKKHNLPEIEHPFQEGDEEA
ncbi:hypothetical protein A2V68_00565 [candidate division Kazan bacterium RBG_13_50_9]|uniref:Uncharacterized protein n=1 Tax=candidate division Kazan bacterium RBG_13_50_9 TaxID=1798535 RepID=A0A1F4NSL3_UNCK3|nr:MAG: hypothetical protein A2V68_00565 [candidate division Kazan bacterium RBG_13_50_9]